MADTIIHIPTGKLIYEKEDFSSKENTWRAGKPLLDIFSPDGRNVFSIEKLIEGPDEPYEFEQEAA